MKDIKKKSISCSEKICIDANLPLEKRLLGFMAQVENPYEFQSGKLTVRLYFDPAAETLEKRLESCGWVMNAYEKNNCL